MSTNTSHASSLGVSSLAKPSHRKGRRVVRKRSAKEIYGWPLYDIAIGPNEDGSKGHAKGIFAMGQRATGIVAIGGLAQGVIAIGGLSWGLLTIGGVTVGLLGCIGGVAIGGMALGGVAIGGLTRGGLSIGLWAMGGKNPTSLL